MVFQKLCACTVRYFQFSIFILNQNICYLNYVWRMYHLNKKTDSYLKDEFIALIFLTALVADTKNINFHTKLNFFFFLLFFSVPGLVLLITIHQTKNIILYFH